MSTPTLDQSPTSPENGQLAGDVRRRGGGPPSARRVTKTVAAVALCAALLSAGAVTGLLAAVGALGGSTNSTNVVERLSTSSGSGTASGLNAKALYASSAAGVVDITARGVSAGGGQGGGPFGPPSQSQTTAAGSGSVIDGQGRILTAAHVVAGASSITVTFQDGSTRTAKVLGQDQSSDIALLKAWTFGAKS